MSSGVLKLAGALANVNRHLAAVPPNAAGAGRAVSDLGSDEEQLARREGRSAAPPASRTKPGGELTREERDRLAREAADERDRQRTPEKPETEQAAAEFRSFRVRARSEFVAAVDEAVGDLDDAGADVIEYIGDAGEEYVDALGDSAQKFDDIVTGAADELSGVSKRVVDDLRTLARAGGADSFASEGFDPVTGEKTGGAISDAYLNQMIDDYNRLYEANQRYARGEGSTAARARNQSANKFGMHALEDLWERIASRFARLEDLARERRQQKVRRTRRRTSSATPSPKQRTNRSQLP